MNGIAEGMLVGARDELIVEVVVAPAPAVPERLEPSYVNVPKIGLWNSPTTQDGNQSRSIVVVTTVAGVFVIMRS